MAELRSAASTPFAVRDCALITRATGVRAENIREFRRGITEVHDASIYHHFWGRLLRPTLDEPEYNNDFASWAWRDLHDGPLAERLSMVVPTDFATLEELRREILTILDRRLEEGGPVAGEAAERPFHFLDAQILIFNTGLVIDSPAGLVPFLPSLSTGSIYFHFIDARNRTPERRNDFSAWLSSLGEEYAPLAARIDGIDPYFSSLKEMRNRLCGAFRQFFGEL